ncbi:MAG: peptidoglycan-binding domain-containing protein [Oculatellaceae cyanobacterium bins.114]|nr:peptidoglycan-binding domain-containing protein [Oculatellaceae cyanobacterium bins.114]
MVAKPRNPTLIQISDRPFAPTPIYIPKFYSRRSASTMSFTTRYALVSCITVGLIGFSSFYQASANPLSLSQSSTLIATAYTDQTLPTLRLGDRGNEVESLQRILLSNGFLGAAGVRLGNPGAIAVDGVFGAVTESAIQDLQQRYGLPVTGIVDPATWEVLDTSENPYREPLPWRQ